MARDLDAFVMHLVTWEFVRYRIYSIYKFINIKYTNDRAQYSVV